MTSRLFGLIPAAGAGARFRGDTPKQYTAIGGQPMLRHAVRALASHPAIELVFVVLAVDDRRFAELDWSAFADRVAPLYCGGPTRRDSVMNGLVAIADTVNPDDWVLVHDAARPCLDQATLARMIDALAGDEVGGILAVPVADTLKRAESGGRIARTEPRDGLWQAQTPQMFRHGVLMRALGAAADVTDEAAAVEALGLRPRLVQGSARNFKVTYAEDVAAAAALLAGAQT
ncbi:MAG: 2-C-methyl-D-erythritol 4-phosphate cytidylyltransferase [Burkholderiales bacterium]|nr:2-C-methyl-D-erythritol 4-phosphate cytidylyltransferase [Burkholderiales bacterium]